MISLMRRHLGDRARLDRLTLAFAAGGIFQGTALMLLIGFLRSFLDGDASGATAWFAWFTGTALVAAVIYAKAMTWATRISVFGVSDSMIQAVGDRLVRLPLGWFDAQAKARVIKILKQDTNTVSHGPSIVLPVITTNLATVGTIMLATLVIDWRMGLTLALASPILWWLYRWQERLLDAPTDEHDSAVEDLGGRVVEFAQAQPVLRAAGHTDTPWDLLDDAITSEALLNQLLQRAQARPASWFLATAMAAMLAALGVGLWLVTSGGLDAITFIALMLIVTRFIEPLSLLIHYAAEVSHVKKAILSAATVLDAPLLPEPDAPAEPSGEGCDLEDVGFGYDSRQVLHGFTLEVAPRTVTALVGPSGSGKTTVLRMLARFWDAEQGRVRHGERDVRELGTDRVMANTAMVFQDVYLFDTSIRENVLIARPDASEEELDAAARAAALDEVLQRLPQGWGTRVGEGGTRLSGGERQRVSLARAFLRAAPVVLLDEATSSLDGLSERRVTDAIASLAETRAVLVIAHRLTTVKGAGTIVTVSDGRVAGTGTHEQLLADPQSIYAQFWADQTRSAHWQLRGTDEKRG
ncbi:MAG TPA: ABC transporter ATP-binding protein [Actinomycetaceae bacterium]|nr:ABC transporter ATP-binding protein [Actinomycetaceae bacterium]